MAQPFEQCRATAAVLGRLVIGPDHFLAGDLDLEPDLEPDPDVEGAPSVVVEGAGATPDGACTVLPPGAGSGTAFRGWGDGAGGVAGASPDRDGAMVAGFGDWALADGGSVAVAAASTQKTAVTTRVMALFLRRSTCGTFTSASSFRGVPTGGHNLDRPCLSEQFPSPRARRGCADRTS
jgi:hypothetical protein